MSLNLQLSITCQICIVYRWKRVSFAPWTVNAWDLRIRKFVVLKITSEWTRCMFQWMRQRLPTSILKQKRKPRFGFFRWVRKMDFLPQRQLIFIENILDTLTQILLVCTEFGYWSQFALVTISMNIVNWHDKQTRGWILSLAAHVIRRILGILNEPVQRKCGKKLLDQKFRVASR